MGSRAGQCPIDLPEPSVKIGTTEEEAAKGTYEFAAFVMQFGGAVRANLHNLGGRGGFLSRRGGLQFRIGHRLSSQSREYMSSPLTRRRRARSWGGKNNKPVVFCCWNCAKTMSETWVGRHACLRSADKESRSAGRKPGRSEIQASFKSAQKTSRSSRVICVCQRGLKGKNGYGFRSRTRAPGHIGTNGGVPPRDTLHASITSLRVWSLYAMRCVPESFLPRLPAKHAA